MATDDPRLEDNGKPKKGDRKLSALDRCILAAIGDGRKVGLDDDPALKKYPNLWEWMTKTQGGTDHIMQPAVISLQLGPEGVLATVTHRDLRTSCSIACLHLHQALEALDASLGLPNPPLRQWGKDEPHLKKRRQK